MAAERRRQVDQGARDRRRQQDADVVLAGPARGQGAGQGDGAGQGLETRDVGPAPIRKGEAKRMTPNPLDERPMQRPLVRLAVHPRSFAQFLHGSAHFSDRRPGR